MDAIPCSPVPLNPSVDQRAAEEDLQLLFRIFPDPLRSVLGGLQTSELLEVILDLGRFPEARLSDRTLTLLEREVESETIEHVVGRLGRFSADNRAGIERTLHRISAIRNRAGDVVGLTCRVGRAVTGTVEIIRDVVESGRSLLLLGPPGVGKTTLLREAARVLADDVGRRVMVVDTSNEIGGDGDIPHRGIGSARRMQVPSPELQHQVMIEAVENHMPEVIVIDEIGTLEETAAARTIAERGVQLVATAHGLTLENLIRNPTLCDLVGGIQAVTLSDDEAHRRGTRKTVLERKAPPSFATVIEILSRDRLAISHDAGEAVDSILQGKRVEPELRRRTSKGWEQERDGPASDAPQSDREQTLFSSVVAPFSFKDARRVCRIFPVGINRSRLEKAILELQVPARLADRPQDADIVVSLKGQSKRRPQKLKSTLHRKVAFHSIKGNTIKQIKAFLKRELRTSEEREESIRSEIESGLSEVESAIAHVRRTSEVVELAPQKAYVRRRQHEEIQTCGLYSESAGEARQRRVVIYPRQIAQNFPVV